LFDLNDVILMIQVINWSSIIIVKPKKYIQISSLFNIIVLQNFGQYVQDPFGVMGKSYFY